MAPFPESLDEAFHSVSAGWPSRLALHYMHERHYRGALNRKLAVAHNPDLLPVPNLFFLCCIDSHRCSPDTFPFSLLIHRTRSTNVCSAPFDTEVFLRYAYRWVQGLVQNDLQGWVEVYVLMIPRLHWGAWLTFRSDIVLAACDVEGNFLVVKVSSLARTLVFCGVTNLKYHRLINIPTSSLVCSSMRESYLCISTNCLLTSPRWAIPICMFFLWVYMRTHFHWTQILVCLSY